MPFQLVKLVFASGLLRERRPLAGKNIREIRILLRLQYQNFGLAYGDQILAGRFNVKDKTRKTV